MLRLLKILHAGALIDSVAECVWCVSEYLNYFYLNSSVGQSRRRRSTLQWKYAATCPVCSVFGACNRNMGSHMLPVTLTFDSSLPRLIQSGVCVTPCHFFCHGKILTNCFCKVSIFPLPGKPQRWHCEHKGNLLPFRFHLRPLWGFSKSPKLWWRSTAQPVAGHDCHSAA